MYLKMLFILYIFVAAVELRQVHAGAVQPHMCSFCSDVEALWSQRRCGCLLTPVLWRMRGLV